MALMAPGAKVVSVQSVLLETSTNVPKSPPNAGPLLERPLSENLLLDGLLKNSIGDNVINESAYVPSLLDVVSEGQRSELQQNSVASPEQETVIAVKDNPQIKKLQLNDFKWYCTKSLSPSINMAVAHLELLQTVLEEVIENGNAEDFTERLKSAMSDNAKSKKEQRALKFTPTPQPKTPEIAIRGVGGSFHQSAKGRNQTQTPFLGGNEVVEEVVVLLAKLECGRRTLMTSLEVEKERVSNISSQVDKLAKQRMIQLPLAAQREHEACSMDINELNWHVKYKARHLARLDNRVKVAQAFNQRLKEDIEFVKKHCPSLEEKLELENEAMDRIKQAQQDTNDELEVTTERHAKVKHKSEEAHWKAEVERGQMKKDIDNVKFDLQTINNDLLEAQNTYERYIKMCIQYKQQLKDDAEQIQILRVREENVRTAEGAAQERVRLLSNNIRREENVQNELDQNLAKLKTEFRTLSETTDTKIKQLNQLIKKSQDRLKKVERKNDDHQIDIDDYHTKIKKCKDQVEADEKNIARMAKEQERTNEQLNVTLQDLAQIQILYESIREQLAKEQDKVTQEEDAMKAAVDGLKKQIKEQIHAKTVLSARMNSDKSELDETRLEASHRGKKLNKKVAETEAAVAAANVKMTTLKESLEQKEKAIEEIKNEIISLDNSRDNKQKWRNAKYALLHPESKTLEEEVQKLQKTLDQMQWKTDMMNKSIEDMNRSSGMIAKTYKSTHDSIKKFKEEFDEVQMRLDARQKVQDRMVTSLTDIEARKGDNQRRHDTTLVVRKEVLQKTKDQLRHHLALNRLLAARYRQMQNKLFFLKNAQLDEYGQTVQLEVAVLDLKQQQLLQQRMGEAVHEYNKLRELYTNQELERLNADSDNNSIRVRQLKKKMDEALDAIGVFMSRRLDSSNLRQLAMERARLREEGKEVTRFDWEEDGLVAARATGDGVSTTSATPIETPPVTVVATPVVTNQDAAEIAS